REALGLGGVAEVQEVELGTGLRAPVEMQHAKKELRPAVARILAHGLLEETERLVAPLLVGPERIPEGGLSLGGGRRGMAADDLLGVVSMEVLEADEVAFPAEREPDFRIRDRPPDGHVARASGADQEPVRGVEDLANPGGAAVARPVPEAA